MAFKPIATTRSATGVMTAKLAVWWLLASEVVIFGGLLASYVMHRIGHPEWADYAAHTNVYFGGTNTFVLLTSSLSAVLAHQAAERKDGKRAAKLLGLTIAGGGLFLIIKSVEWYGEITHGRRSGSPGLQGNSYARHSLSGPGDHSSVPSRITSSRTRPTEPTAP